MKAIVACDLKGGIGFRNHLPWDKIEGDLPRFKQLTTGQIVIMGRNTWDSLPKQPLPNRTNVVVTSSTIIPAAKIPTLQWQANLFFDVFHSNTLRVDSPDRFVDHDDAWIIGGAKLFETSWPLITELHLTTVRQIYECDTFIDLNYIQQNFIRVQREEHSDHDYEIWKRK